MSATGWAESLRRFNERKKAEKEESTSVYNVFRRFRLSVFSTLSALFLLRAFLFIETTFCSVFQKLMI